MSTTLRPHDLIWLNARDALEDVTESWVDTVWHSGLPVVVRRDVDAPGAYSRGRPRDEARPARRRLGESGGGCSRLLAGIAGGYAVAAAFAFYLSATASRWRCY